MRDSRLLCQERLTRGEPVDLRPEPGKRVDAGDGKNWDSSRIVEASTLTSLLTSADDAESRTHRPLRLAGARITGALDLESVTLTRPLYLIDCFLELPVTLNDANAITISLAGCYFPGIAAAALHTRGDLCLNDGFTAVGNVDLRGAHIGGTLNCDAGAFTNENGTALNGDSLTVDGNMFCREGFTATGMVNLPGAHIGGQFASDGTFTNGKGVALNARALKVDRDMFCSAERTGTGKVIPTGKKFTATGEVNLLGAHIGGTLNCEGGTFTNENGTALNGGSLTVDGNMFCREGFAATGEFNLRAAHIGGQLDCDAGTFTNANGTALEGDALTVGSSLFCRKGFTATGMVNLRGAHIGGQFASDGTFTNDKGMALNARALKVDRDMFCSAERTGTGKVIPTGKKFTATGEVNLLGAHIGGTLNCEGGTFTNENGTALNGDSLTVDGNMFCREGFTATGEVNLRGAHIGGQLDCKGATFANGNSLALRLSRAEVAEEVFFHPTSQASVNLSFAKVGAWHDKVITWPKKGNLWLDGFTYSVIGDDSRTITVRQRLEWLQHDAEGFLPQPYDQLANAYRLQGDEDAARKVHISTEWRRRATVAAVKGWSGLLLRPFRLFWSALLRVTIAYGYRPWQILAPIGILFGFGCWWFTRLARQGGIVPAKDLNQHVHFNGARYSADLLIPGASLGERTHFLATGQTAWWAAGYTVAGWALAAMLIAGLTGVFKRQ